MVISKVTSPPPDHDAAACLTLDIDWAPDHVLEDTHLLLKEAGLPATIFATHQSPAVTNLLALPGVETGVHPNFLGGVDEDAVLTRLLAAFPGAAGLRSHALYYHSRLLPLFHRQGIRFFSNDLMFLHPALAPYHDWSGLVRLPLYWEDDVHCLYFDARFDLAALRLEQPGLKVFNFHPAHLFLNTLEMSDYEAAKPALADAGAARSRQRAGIGTRSLFLELVTWLRGQPTRTLGQVAGQFSAAHPFAGHTAEHFARQSGKQSAP